MKGCEGIGNREKGLQGTGRKKKSWKGKELVGENGLRNGKTEIKRLKEKDGVRQETRLQECAEEQDHPSSSTCLHSQASITPKYKARHRRGNTSIKSKRKR